MVAIASPDGADGFRPYADSMTEVLDIEARRDARPPLSLMMREELGWLVEASRAPRVRGLVEWGADEIVLPDGPYAGMRWDPDVQPVLRLALEEIDSGRWRRYAVMGPVQSGKTLTFWVIPMCHRLFELKETTIAAVPKGDMAHDKWKEDIEPVIKKTQYAGLMPTSGHGSRGGSDVVAIRFKNGVTLRFMTGGGNDKTVAGFTSKNVLGTETDGMDQPTGTSREADRITQLEGRTAAYDTEAFIGWECTVSTKAGRTWREYKGGSMTRPFIRCPLCQVYVCPEREHFSGWQEAKDVIEAGENARFYCPSCGGEWDEDLRREANLHAVLVHKGQTVDENGVVHGEMPRVNTFSFRYSAVNNLMMSMKTIGEREWNAKYGEVKDEDEENPEKALCQFVWANPYEPPSLDIAPLDVKVLVKRVSPWQHGEVPGFAEWTTLGIDVGKRQCHWTLMSFVHVDADEPQMAPILKPYIVDYGVIEVASDEFGEDKALPSALADFRDERVEAGWMSEGGRVMPVQIWIDSRYRQDLVYAFCKESGDRWRPTIGFGELTRRRYTTPKKRNKEVRWIGDNMHFVTFREKGATTVVQLNADYWKSRLHESLSASKDAAGACMLSSYAGHNHKAFAKHLTAEKLVKKDGIDRWVQVHSNNHWLDSTCLALGAGHFWRAWLEKQAKSAAVSARWQGRKKS